MKVIFLHGWGQSREIWCRQMQAFPDALFLNLPGHGGADGASDWLAATVSQLPDSPSIIVGWSLGGMLAMQLALQYSEKVAGLVLVSTTPSFCNRDGWEYGCSSEMFRAFEDGINNNLEKTMNRFFATMLHGDEITRSELNQVTELAVDSNSPSVTTLKVGLDYLAVTDLREKLSQIKQPTLVLHGENDVVIPIAAGKVLNKTIPNSSMQRFKACGHAPFLIHSRTFNTILESWCQKI